MIKKALKRLVINVLIYRERRHYKKGLNNKKSDLLKTKQFKKYPMEQNKPIVCNYPFYNTQDKEWFDFYYSVYNIPSTDFIPPTIYNLYVEPRLNQYLLSKAIEQKNSYDLYMDNVKTPKTLLRRINNFYYDSHYEHVKCNDTKLIDILSSYPEIIIKPSIRSGSGNSIMKFGRIDGDYFYKKQILNVAFLNDYDSDFIIQEVVKQHRFFRQFNPGSNNTIRVLTYRSVRDDAIHILHTLLRIGRKDCFMDHDNLGGVVIAITKDGYLKDCAIDAKGIKHESFNNINFKEISRVPFIEDIHQAAEQIAGKIYYGRLLAMDFTINENGEPLLIDINCESNGVSQYQMNNGTLFREFTVEVLDFCSDYYRINGYTIIQVY